MKKIIVLLFSIILITGCEVSYNVTINEDDFNENLSINEIDLSKFSSYNLGDDFDYYDRMPFPKSIDNSELSYKVLNNMDRSLLYEKTNILNEDGITFGISGRTENNSNFYKSNLINTFGNVEYETKNNINYIKYSLTSDLLKKYNMVDVITINVIDKNNCVLSNNADKKDGDKYTWLVTKDNYLTKSIDFSYSIKEVVSKKTIKNSIRKLNDPLVKFGVVIAGICLLCLIIYKYIILRYNSSNKL